MAIGSVSTGENLDPAHEFNTNEAMYTPNIYDPLFWLDNSWTLHPVLAESWTPNAAATRWTFTLRSGVRWHSGDPFTAMDVVYTLRRILDAKVGVPGYGSLAPILDPDGVKAADARTLVLTLKQPAATLPLLLAGAMGGGVIHEGTTDFSKTANGTGPFRLLSFTPGQTWQLERNPHYWQKGLPYLEGARGAAATDPTTKVESVLSGNSDIADNIDFSLANLAATSHQVSLRAINGATESYIILDTRQPPFTDNRVRMAFKLAMDRRLICQTAYQGHSVFTSDTCADLTDSFYPPSLGIRAQNLAAARGLLAAAGHTAGLDVELHTSDLIGGILDMSVAFAKTVQPAGIRVTLKQSSAANYFTQVWKQVPMFVSWVSHAPPEVRLTETFTSNGQWQETHYKNTPVDAWVSRGYATLDHAQRTAIWRQALHWISYNEGYLNPGFSDALFPLRATLRGVAFYWGPSIDLRNTFFAS
jgi:peptide/nickel transport system substrate-binding protein